MAERKQRMTFVYLAESFRGKVFKVGISSDPFKRLAGLKASAYYAIGMCQLRFRLIRVLPGSKAKEAWFLARLNHLRIRPHGEWLWGSPEIAQLFDSKGARIVKTKYQPVDHGSKFTKDEQYKLKTNRPRKRNAA